MRKTQSWNGLPEKLPGGMRQKCLVALACGFSILSLSGSVTAATITWTNTAGGNWNVAANWSPNQVPGSADTALITNNGSYTVTVSDSEAANIISLGGSSGTQTLNLPSGVLTLESQAIVNSNGEFDVTGGTLNGNMVIFGTLTWTNGVLGDSRDGITVATSGLFVLAGTNGADYSMGEYMTNAGTIELQSGNLEINYCGAAYGELVNLPGALVAIQSGVSIDNGCGGQDFINEGLVQVSGPTGTTAVNVPFDNTGTLEMQNGTVELTEGGDLNGTFVADAGSAIDFAGGNFSATSPLNLGGAGTYAASGGTLTSTFSLPSNLQVNGGSVILNLTGPLPNLVVTNGNWTVNGAVSNLLVGGGALAVNGAVTNALLSGGTLGGNMTIFGTLTWTNGVFGDSNAGITVATNALLVLAGINGTDYTLGEYLTNAGTIELQSGNLEIDWCGAYFGELVNLPGALVDIRADVSIDNTCGGPGVINEGTVRVDDGTANLNGPFNNAEGTLDLVITNVSSYGQLVFGSPLTMAGTLEATIDGGYQLAPGDAFSLLSYPSRTGAFTYSLPPESQWEVNNGENSLSITATNILLPIITTEPQSQEALVGDMVTFTVVATNGSPLSYQWQFNGTSLTDGGQIYGSQGSILDITAINTTNVGNYDVIIANSFGSVTSAVATLSIVTIVPAFTPSSGIINNDSSKNNPVNLGMVFTPDVATSVNALGFYNDTNNGFISAGETVAIYNASGMLITQSFVPTNSQSFDGYYWQAISPVTLMAGQQYVVDAFTGDNGWSYGGSTEPGVNPQITYDGQVYLYSPGLQYPTEASGHAPTAYYGPNFSIVSSQIAPAIIAQPANQFVLPGGTAQFNVTASGTQPLLYQWQFDGANLADGGQTSGSESNTLTITAAATNDVGSYQVIVANNYGSVTSSVATLMLEPTVSWTNPSPIVYGTALGSLQLDATASVPGTFAYTPAAGTVLNAGTSVLTVVFAPTNTIDYASVTDTVSLTVEPAPLMVTANNASRIYGQNNPTFTGTLTGVVNGDNITASYSCSAVSFSPPGRYPIVPGLNDPNGRLGNYSVTINDGTLTVTAGAPPELTGVTPAKGLTNGDTAVTLTGSGFELGAGVLFSNQPATSVSVNNGTQITAFTPAAPLGTINVTVTNPDATVAILTNGFTYTGPPPIVQGQPNNLVVVQGGTAIFQVNALYAAAYQWQFDGGNLIDNGRISGSQTAALTIPDVQPADAGSYQVVMTNIYGSTVSAAATLSVVVPPDITSQPQSQSVGIGGTAVFTVGASGTTPFSYQWFSNNVVLPGATGPTLTLSDAQSGEAGPYSVVVANLGGSATSTAATLSVLDYCASAQPGQAIYPMGSVVPITAQTLVCGSQTPVPNQTVTVWISNNGFVRSLPATTSASGSTIVNFVPLPTEAGMYQVAAALPGQATPAAQSSFTLAGIGLSTNNISAQVTPGLEKTNIVILTNLTSVDLTGMNASVIGSTPDVTVQLNVPGTLSGNATGELSCVLTAPGNAQAEDQFSILLTSALGTTNLVSVTATVVPAVPQLAVTPSSLNASMVQGGQTLVNFQVENIGGATSGPVSVDLPQVPWLTTVTPQPIPPLAPGQSNQVTLALTPPSNLTLGAYSGNLELTTSNQDLSVPFTFDCISTAVGALQVTVQDELTYYSTGAPNVSNATITVSDFQTGEEITNAVTDGSGIVLFTNLTSDYYTVSVTAPEHSAYSTTMLVSPDVTNDLTAFLPLQLVDYTWVVTPTEVPDEYQFTLNTTFETQVPWPVVTVSPAAIDLCNIQGDSTQIDLTIANNGLIAADGLNLYFGSHPDWSIQPLVSSLGTLLPETNMIVPVTITRIGTSTGVPSQVPAQLSYFVPALNATNYTVVPIYVYDANPVDCEPGTPTPVPVPVTCSSCGGGAFVGGGGVGEGSGGSGGGGVTITMPTYSPATPQGALVEVQLQIDQTAVISRDGFHATLNLQNNAGSTVSNLQVTITVYDASNNVANSLFGISSPTLSGLNAVNGTGVMGNSASGDATWTIVPATNAAPQVATQYSVGGTLSYTLNGEPVTIPFFAVPITVQPCPIFTVDYFLQHDVYSQDPFVTQYEPPIPFGLGIIVKNNGYGSANNFSITSGQPQIVGNSNDLLIAFSLIGSQIGTNESLSPSFTLDFGDLGPQSSGVGLWYMTSSLDGQFVAFDASFQHVDDFGNTNTSLISSVNTYEMNHVVQLPADNGQPDFLVNDTTNLNALPDVVFASDGSTSPVTSLSISNTTTAGTAPAPGQSVTLEITNVSVPSGWVYLEAVDPSGGVYPIVSVKRSDGNTLVVGPNVWQTPQRTDLVPSQPNALIHIFDYDPTGTYIVTYGLPVGAPTNYTLAATQITPTTAVLNADVYPNGQDTRVYFEWGTTTNYQFTTETTYADDLYSFQDVALGLGGLQPHTIYHYQAVAINSQGTDYGGDAMFETLTNPPPAITQVTNQSVADGQTLVITNHVAAAAYPVTYSLGSSAPDGAIINTNGILRWQPTCEQGSSNYTITVTATDSSSPPLTSSMTFSVAVGECVQVALGSTAVQIGQTGAVPVTLISSIPLTNLNFTVLNPSSRFINWTFAPSNSSIENPPLQILSSSNVSLNFNTFSGQTLDSQPLLGTLYLTPLPGPSAFLPLVGTNILGTALGGTNAGDVESFQGRIAVIGAEPLIEPGMASNSSPTLMLYGNPGTNYEIIFTTNLFSPDWQIWSSVQMTNVIESIHPNPTSPQIFYRALEQP